MSKELEAFDRILNANNHFKYDTLELVEKDFQIVKQALQRLESIDNSKPSEALEWLKQQAIAFEHSELAIEVANENYASIKQALIKSQEQEKVLKIIKKKVFPLNHHTMIINHYKEYRSYHSAFNQFYEDVYDAEKYLLSKEDFELLKRYFNE